MRFCLSITFLICWEIFKKCFKCKFFTDSWEKNWVYSEHPGKEFGKFVLSHGKFWNDPENDKGKQEKLVQRIFILYV